MKLKSNLSCLPLVAAAAVFMSSPASASTIPVTGWAVHNQSTPAASVSDGGTNSPTFTPADNAVTVMGTFPEVQLEEDGDYVKLSTTLTMGTRFGNINENNLNTLLRIGLYNGPDGPVALQDIPNTGIFIVYGNHNQADNRRIRQQSSLTNINPLSGTNNIGASGTEDDGLDSIRGADPGPVYFELKLIRNAGALDITGQISGTDSVTGNPYLSNYAATGFVPGNVGFDFNRVAFFFGNNVDAPNATLNDVIVKTNIPEPASLMLLIAAGAAACGRRPRR